MGIDKEDIQAKIDYLTSIAEHDQAEADRMENGLQDYIDDVEREIDDMRLSAKEMFAEAKILGEEIGG